MAGNRGSVHLTAVGPPGEDAPRLPRVVHTNRRWRYWRRHTPHFYLVLFAISCAILMCPLNAIAYSQHDLTLGVIACVGAGVTTLAVSCAFFWGFFLLLSGQIPAHRLKYVLPHACVGTLSPLLYMLNLSLAFDAAGHRPVSIWLVVLSIVSVVLLGLQFSMGRVVVRRKRPHMLRSVL